jgi:hypothetical protein
MGNAQIGVHAYANKHNPGKTLSNCLQLIANARHRHNYLLCILNISLQSLSLHDLNFSQ